MNERVEKKRLMITIKNILYFVEDKKERDRLLSILEKYNDMLPDSKFKDMIDKFRKKFTIDYYGMVDYFVDDILDGKMTEEKKKIITQMLNEIQPVVNSGSRSLLEKFFDLFSWD